MSIQATLTEGTLESVDQVGRLRTGKDKVVVEDQATSQILHVPPDARELPARLQKLCDFANQPQESDPFTHPVIRAAILHFMMGYDHPFVDGNGRTARALFYWSALRSGYWLLEYASISKAIRQAPIRYGLAYLHSESDDGDLTYFLIYHLDIVLKAIKSLHEYLDRKSKELEEFETMVRKNAGPKRQFNDRQIHLLEEAIRRPGSEVTIDGHRQKTGVSYLTARSDLEHLSRLGMLKKAQRGNRSIYKSDEKMLSKLGMLKSAKK